MRGPLAVGAAAVGPAAAGGRAGAAPHRPVGLADRQQTRRSAGELRARRRPPTPAAPASTPACWTSDTAPLAEVGFAARAHARGTGEPVVLTLEDQVGIIAPTGAGKTLYLMVAACLDAPGPLVATSTKPEVLDAIVETRTGKGRVWVFDPLNIANWPEPMIWNPVAGAEDSAAAVARGEAFAGGLAGADSLTRSNPFFRYRRRDHHRPAPARRRPRPGSTMVDVVSWALELERSTTARGHPAAATPHARAVVGADPRRTASEGADETAVLGADDPRRRRSNRC